MPRTTKAARPDAPAHAPGGVGSVDRALALLRAFTLATPLRSLSELAAHTQQYKSTVLRMLASLEAADLICRQADGRFGLGPAVARLGAVQRSTFSLVDVVQPVLLDLVDATLESASFHVQQGEQDLCLYRVDSPHPVRDHRQAGDVQPVGRSIVGPVMSAHAGRGGSRSARIRRDQLFVTDGDVVAELAAVAAPVYAPDGTLAGVLALTMPSVRFDPACAPRVADAARRITHGIGGQAPQRGANAGQGTDT